MKMYERFIPTPVTIEDYADQFRENVGSLKNTDHKKMFTAWVIDLFNYKAIVEFFGLSHHSGIYYYLRQHKAHMETDEIYRRKFERL